MNICLFTPSFLPKIGGMEVVIDRLARLFTDAGHRVTVLAKTPRDGGTATGLPYPVVYYPRSRSQVWLLGSTGRALLAEHGRGRFDVIHAHQAYPTGYVATQLKDRLGVPVIITSHRGDIGEASRYRRRWITRRRMTAALCRADAVTGVSPELKQIIDDLAGGQARSTVIPNGVDLDVVPPTSPPAELESLNGRPYALTLGRLHPYKGLDVLLKALAMLRNHAEGTGGQAASGTQGPIAFQIPHLVIAGDGPIRAELERQAGELGLADAVTFAGPVFDDAKNWLLANCLFFLQPSRQEGMPLTVLEAMAAGKAIVGSDLPGIRQLVTPARSGVLSPPGSAEFLAVAIANLLADRAAMERMSVAARHVAGGYAWPAMAGKYLDLFSRCIAAR